jgi:uncharacterized protein (TIGR03067 family)
MVVVVLLLGAGSAQEKKASDDAKKFQGTWSLVSFDHSGKKLADDDLKKMKVVIKDDTITIDAGNKVER